MTIQGCVEQIIFCNETNNYMVVDLSCSGELITAVGIFPTIQVGETLMLEGEYQVNPRFGEQFKVSNVKFVAPTTKEDVVAFLSSGLIKGLGKNKAKSIVDVFGEKTLDIIETTPIRLTEIRGIGKKTAMEIADSYQENKQMKDTIMYLQKYDITTNLSIKIYKAYKGKVQRVLEENPYKLIDDIDGVGFVIADRIAMSMGVNYDSVLRIRAGINYVLTEKCTQSGNTCLPKGETINAVMETLKIYEENKITEVLDTMTITGEIKETVIEEKTFVSKNIYYYSELGIAEKMIALFNGASEIHINLEADISEFEFINDIKLHEAQKKAVENAVQNGIEIITGGPGTGKTTIIKAILSILKSKGQKVALAAPTGRASKRLQEATGENAKTLHRLLGINPSSDGGAFLYNERNKLPYDTVIIDEISMVDVILFNSFLKALEVGTRLILVGDKDQLPSVSPGNVLKDLISSKIFSVDMLTQIYRQDEDSLIITNAHRINTGEMPIITGKAKDFFFEEHLSSEDNLQTVLDLCYKRLPGYTKVSPKEIQVLAPIKRGVDGVNNLNVELQKLLNPPSDRKRELHHGSTIFREGDKVMQTVNNYDLEWTGETDGVGVFNGDMGEIRRINTSDKTIEVEFEDGRRAVYSDGEFDQLILSYAISIHKSQGSEFDVLVICISSGGYIMLNRNLLYTAVTRAKKTVIIVGSKKHLYHMVKNDEVTTRYSLLRYLLTQTMNSGRTIGYYDGF